MEEDLRPIIIKWAIYTDGDELLRPHYNWFFFMVDCTEYKTKEQMKEIYSEKFIKEALGWLCLEYKWERYYECEFSPHYTEWLEILSDISDIEFYDDDRSF